MQIFQNCKTNTALILFFFFFFCFFNTIFKYFVNFNTTQGQLLLGGADSVMKRQEEDDRMESWRILTFYTEIEERDHERFKTLNRGVQRMKKNVYPHIPLCFYFFY